MFQCDVSFQGCEVVSFLNGGEDINPTKPYSSEAISSDKPLVFQSKILTSMLFLETLRGMFRFNPPRIRVIFSFYLP